MTGKERMLCAYRGQFADRIAIAPELWYYYPAKLMGVDLIEFEREVPFHQALKQAFSHFGCEGWGIVCPGAPNPLVTTRSTERWLDADTLEIASVHHTPHGDLTSRRRYLRHDPSWTLERPLKDLERDLPAWECLAFGAEPENLDCAAVRRSWVEVGEAYLREGLVGGQFFDFVAGALEGGLEEAVALFLDPEQEPLLRRLQERHQDLLVRRTRRLCEHTPLESLFISCSWSCNSLIGPHLWRRWDKPGVAAVVAEAHRHGRLVHLHFHGQCRETVADFAELGLDCVCPFERPPGGDIAGLAELQAVARQLAGRVTMNGNLHTVETLIRGTPDQVRAEVAEVLTAFAGEPRVILGTGDQVGGETPEENLWAMIEAGKRFSPQWQNAAAASA